LPQTPDELIQISGFGQRKVEQFGDAVLRLVTTYCEEHHLQSHIGDKTPKRQRKTKTESKVKGEKADTRLQSFLLWQQGLSIAEIATHRKLQPSTIESHLATYVQKGEIPVTALVPPALLEKCEAVILELEAQTVGPVKEIMGEDLSYNQIRLVIDLMHQKTQ
jgi:ATP-dependent DNA helicase RecQ